jgi:hypothetical protein
VDNTAPSPPTGLAAAGATGSAVKTISGNVPVGQASPVVAVSYVICDATGAACGAAQNVPVSGPAFSFPVTVGEGTHLLKAWLTDQAGNFTPANAASVAVNVTTPVDPALELTRVLTASHKVVATVAERGPGPVDVRIVLSDARGHRVRMITRRLALRNGRASVTFTPTRTTRHVSFQASAAASTAWLAATAHRTLILHHSHHV